MEIKTVAMMYDVKHVSLFSRIMGNINLFIRQINTPDFAVIPQTTSKEFEAIFNSQTEILNAGSLLSVSDLKGNITYVNENFCRISKYSAEELIGKPHNIVRHSDTPASVFKEMWQTIGNGKVWQGEIKNKDKDGNPYWVFATVAPVIGENGKPVKYISMRHDITQQKIINEELRKTKILINTELIENVNYAKSVHYSFLTSEKDLAEAFPESILIYKARNIVSGDFYMVHKTGKKSSIILGDSTGHGVSASYISIMILNMIGRVMKLTNFCPAKSLENLHKKILYATNSNGISSIIESADMAFCRIDHEKMVMEYALAKMRGVIVRNQEIIELESERCSVGDHKYEEIVIKKRIVNLQKHDKLYLFTDGIIDQFGGSLNKKFGKRQLFEFLKKYGNYKMKVQEEILNEIIVNWQGANEQTDDICLLGIEF